MRNGGLRFSGPIGLSGGYIQNAFFFGSSCKNFLRYICWWTYIAAIQQNLPSHEKPSLSYLLSLVYIYICIPYIVRHLGEKKKGATFAPTFAKLRGSLSPGS